MNTIKRWTIQKGPLLMHVELFLGFCIGFAYVDDAFYLALGPVQLVVH